MKLFGFSIIPTKQLDKTLSEFALLKKSLRQQINDWVEDGSIRPEYRQMPNTRTNKQTITKQQNDGKT